MAGSPTTSLLISGFRSLILKVSTPTDWNNTKPRSDLIGIKVWCSATIGFTPDDGINLIYNGPVTTSIIIPNLDIHKTYYVRYAFISSIDPTVYTYSKEYYGTVYDENTSIYGFLSNDPINVPSEVLGVNPDFTNATGVFKMFSFSQDITGNGPTYGIKSGSATGGIVSTINATTGIYTVTDLTSDNGSITFTASYTNSWATLTVERTLTVSKSKQGYSSAFFSIDNSAITFKRAVDTSITPASVTLTTSAQNIANPTYKWYRQTNGTGSFVEISGATNSSYTVSNSNYNATTVVNTYRCTVTGTINNTGGQSLSDQITIPLLIDSSSAISVTNSNENITFTAPVFGYSGINFAGSSSQIRVYIGTEQLSYATSGDKTFDCTISASGVTVTSSGSGNVFTVNAPTAISSDTASVTVTINIRDAAGSLTNLTTVISYSLSRTGFSSGLFSIQNSAVIFKKSVDGTISPSSITLTTEEQNIDSATKIYKWYKLVSGSFNEISGANSSSYIVANTEYASAITNTYRVELACKINNVPLTLGDQITIPLLIDGSSAISITNSNENITFAAPTSGYDNISFTGGSSQIRVYIGTEQLSYATSGAKTFNCTIDTSGVSVTSSGSGNVFTVNAPSAIYSDIATTTVNITIRNAAGEASSLKTIITYSLSRRGVQGVSRRLAYSKTTLNSLANTPTSITTTGNTSFPAAGSWGSDTAWQATSPSIVAGESVYQTDGLYDEITGNTVWGVPYLNYLKVAKLSAITANIGEITAGSMTGVSLAVGTTPPTIGSTSITAGAGAKVDSNGRFALGNSTTNVTFNNDTGILYLNGDVVATGNIKANAITVEKIAPGSSAQIAVAKSNSIVSARTGSSAVTSTLLTTNTMECSAQDVVAINAEISYFFVAGYQPSGYSLYSQSLTFIVYRVGTVTGQTEIYSHTVNPDNRDNLLLAAESEEYQPIKTTRPIITYDLPSTTETVYYKLNISVIAQWVSTYIHRRALTAVNYKRANTGTPTFNITSQPSTINEGSSGQFIVGTTNFTGTLYWTINNNTSSSSDFSYLGTAGSFAVSSNTGQFSITPVADSTTEGDETFTVSIRTDSISGPIVATSSTVTIADTSTSGGGGGGSVGTLGFNGKTYGFIKSTSGVAKLTLRFFSNGIWQIIPSNTGSDPTPQNDLSSWALVSGNWSSPTTAGVGSGYLYRVQATTINIGNGSVYPDNTDPGSWLAFTETGSPELAFVAISTASGETSGDFKVEIAVNNSGSPGTIVSTNTFSFIGSRGE